MSIKDLINKYQTLIKYMLAAFLGHLLNFLVAYILYVPLDRTLIFSNSTGLVAGFLFTFVASRVVFHKKYSLKGFLVYLGTFLLGLVLDNLIIHFATIFFNQFLKKSLAFLISKIISGIVPFIVSYAIRKKVFKGDFV